MIKVILKILKWLLIVAFWWSLFTSYPDIAVVIGFGYLLYKAIFTKN